MKHKQQQHEQRFLWTMSLVVLSFLPIAVTAYANITLHSNDLSVTIYLPQSVKPEEEHYYQSSRFEHGSMIGSILRKANKQDTMLYGTRVWRVPHNPWWPESGVGLASEFGVGDDGAFCNYRCGWYGVSDVSNGVLGYIQAKNGEPFLKIGVGLLEKGSCPTCDSSEDYKFNSPYAFAEPPAWSLTSDPDGNDNKVSLEHEAVLHSKRLYGYRLRKDIELDPTTNVLTVTTTLTNLGQDAFTTPWYSHHFFSCNNRFIGSGYSVDLYTKPQSEEIFDEPSLWSWSSPLRDYADVSPVDDQYVEVEMTRQLDAGVRIKAEFPRDDSSNGSFTLKGCGTCISESIPQVSGGQPNLQANSDVSMYAFNLYVERGTLSPEPQLLIHLDPGRTSSWTQRLEFASDDDAAVGTKGEKTPLLQATAAGSLVVVEPSAATTRHFNKRHRKSVLHRAHELLQNETYMLCMIVSCLVGVAVVVTGRRNSFSSRGYTAIPDEPPQQLHEEA